MAEPLFVWARQSSGGVDVQSVQARREFVLQDIIDGPMSRQTGETAQNGRPYCDGIMCFTPRCCTSMTMVKVRLIHYIHLVRGKSSNQSSANALYASCQFLRH